MLKRDALKLVGGLSKPGKMPCPSIGLPARACKVGSMLHLIENSVCSDCYALKGQYGFANVQAAQYRRLDLITGPNWVEAMVTLLADRDYFRWHDSGDLQDMEHLLRIVQVCEQTPNCQHWLPTREKALIKAYRRNFGAFPSNLCVRISDAMIDAEAGEALDGFATSGVTRDAAKATCPAPKQGGECRDCRACWDVNVARVVYRHH